MLLDDIATVLETDGGVSANAILLTSGARVPSGAGPYVQLRETGGVAPEKTHNFKGASYQRPGVQLTVIGVDPEAVRATISNCYFTIVGKNDGSLPVREGIRNRTINGVWYREVYILNEPFDDGRDDTGDRVQYKFNFIPVKQAT